MLLNEIINEVGMTKRAVKYYEEKGLLSVDKDNNGYRNLTVKAYVHSTFLHIVLCWINRLMFALVVQMRRHAKETMPTTLLIGRTLNTSKN